MRRDACAKAGGRLGTLAAASVQWLRAAGAALISVALPAACRICERLLTTASRVPVCDACIASFKRIDRLVCDKCGSPIEAAAGISGPAAQAYGASEWDAETFVCPVCLINEKQTYAFDRVRSWAAYEGAIVKAILLLKFEDIEPLGRQFAKYLAAVVVREGAAFEADVIIPVPLHRERHRERGYNQAALIAKPLARILRLPYKPVLSRIRPRPDKRILTHDERWESVRGAFATRAGSQVDNLRVLLVDDVLTTGATLDSCAKTLREAGAKAVAGVTVARAIFRNAADRFR